MGLGGKLDEVLSEKKWWGQGGEKRKENEREREGEMGGRIER